MDGLDVFEALAASYHALCVAVRTGNVVVGEAPGLRFGSLGGGIPDINRLMPTHMADATADRDLDAALEELRESPVLSAWIPPDASPADIADRFLARGFQPAQGDGDPAMVADLETVPAQRSMPGVEIRRVATRDEVDAANRALADGFEAPTEMGTFFANLTAGAVLDPAGSARTFLATLEGRPVATALAFVHAGVLAVYSVATVPDARGLGLGRAVTIAAMQEGADRGAGAAVLEASTMGRPVYEKLGFQVAGRYQILSRTADAGP
jgi:GNAT superfamily N-acetyltransferase